jgi:hypothetical protein
MARKRYKPEEIVAKLRQVEVLVSQGQNMVDAIRHTSSRTTSMGADQLLMPSARRGISQLPDGLPCRDPIRPRALNY